MNFNAKTGIEMTIYEEKTGIESPETGTEIAENRFLTVLTDTERKVVELIVENPEITQEKIAKHIGMSKNGVRYVMDKLKNKGVLIRKGATKKGKWLIHV